MSNKNTTPFCVICRTHNRNGAGITSSDGVHLCLDCAEMIYDVMGQFHAAHLDNCPCCACCSKSEE